MTSRLQARWTLIGAAIGVVSGVGCVYVYLQSLTPPERVKTADGRVVPFEEYERIKQEEAPVLRDDIASYRVAPDKPRVLSIPKLGVYARIRPVGKDGSGRMQAPASINDVGWYSESALPGVRGAMMMAGHASGRTRLGLFARLDTLDVGDVIVIETGDKTVREYRVTQVMTVPVGRVDMNAFARPQAGVSEGLNLITCAGEWLNGDNYTQRVIVYASRNL